MQKRVLIITGMHRSGTSLITQWLSKCGLQTGEKLVPGGYGNVEGHFEDIEFLKMHEEILAGHNLPTTGLTVEHVAQFTLYERKSLKALLKLNNSYTTNGAGKTRGPACSWMYIKNCCPMPATWLSCAIISR
ncbi:hypothetical protein ACFJIV_04105 [Mucilaginibacter sp. UC70_90]